MPAFDYVSLDKNGRRHKGVLEADSARAARQMLRERSLAPLTLHETSGAGRHSKQAGAVKQPHI